MNANWHYSSKTKNGYLQACAVTDPTVKKMYKQVFNDELDNLHGLIVFGEPAFKAMVDGGALTGGFFDGDLSVRVCMKAAGKNGLPHYLQMAIGWVDEDQALSVYNCLSEMYCNALGIPTEEISRDELHDIRSITIRKADNNDLLRITSDANILDIFGEIVDKNEVEATLAVERCKGAIEVLVNDGNITKRQQIIGAMESTKAAARNNSLDAGKLRII